ncbi:hypothetical protein ACQUSR_01745 [Streptomyces sp. P1-3]|uniref:hypothetical protein n=1 Tax=Streptomyces sp. P1-3 TaxID=3421658 RepID=UPI003D35C7BA
MWPGQQPPGGEQNPQQPNPYQQPGYQQPGYPESGYQQLGQQQPNPYQQPGGPYQQQPGHQPNPYQQPAGQNPYQQPGQQPYDQPRADWKAPAGPPGSPEPPRNGGKRTATIAIVTAAAVIAAAVVTGVLVLGKDDDGKGEAKGAARPSAPSSASDRPEPGEDTGGSDADGDGDNGQTGADGEVKAVLPGWDVVVNRKRHNAFDVPADWKVKGPSWSTGFADDNGKPLVSMSSPAYFKDKWCTVEKDGSKSTSSLAGVGTKGAQGAKNEAEAARVEAGNWALAGFDQDQKGDLKVTAPKPFRSAHGITGYVSSATVTGVPKKNKCDSDGKAYAVAYTDINGDYAVWVLYAAKNVADELPDAVVEKIMSTLRPLKPATTS